MKMDDDLGNLFFQRSTDWQAKQHNPPRPPFVLMPADLDNQPTKNAAPDRPRRSGRVNQGKEL